ncbi:winged helix-turn-helix transcriptional regulator [Kribbella sp. NBC_00662]|uniref:winged helix-turn-helix transcriptional regulator n=1 Tax=Kribbella sp. NBC_00662 TaxID=2975969 RepID=UPI00352B73EB
MAASRLRELEAAEIVRRRRFAPSSTSAYELTERGRALEPVLTAIRHWGAELPADGANRPWASMGSSSRSSPLSMPSSPTASRLSSSSTSVTTGSGSRSATGGS